jgi:MOSC domain-containing protein YiiM
MSSSNTVQIGAGDSIEWTQTDEPAVTVAEVVTLYTSGGENQGLLQRAIDTPALPQAWRVYFRRRIEPRAVQDA